MKSKSMLAVLMAVNVVAIGEAVGDQNPPAQLEVYRQQGVSRADPVQGRQLWFSIVNDRSCASCHGEDPGSAGKHIKTGKVIKAMAQSVNPERYQNGKKIEKWFLRNCKWTFGRECNLQEKADILTWLSSQ